MDLKLKSHLGYHVSLAAMLLIGVSLAIQSASDPQLQLLVIFMTSVFYVIWGIAHHLINHDLTSKIVVEYVLIGSLGLTLMLFLFKGSG